MSNPIGSTNPDPLKPATKTTDQKAIPPEGLSPEELQKRVDDCAEQLNQMFVESTAAKDYGPVLSGLALSSLASQIMGLNMVIQFYRENNKLPEPEECQEWFGEIFVVHALRGFQSGVMQQAAMILEKMPQSERDVEAGRVGMIVEQNAPRSTKTARPSGLYIPPNAKTKR